MLTTLNTANAQAVTTTEGAQLASYTKNGREYIWPGTPEIWPDHTPILFPIIGGLINERINIERKPYNIRKHGFARYSRFTLINTTAAAAEYELKATEETKRSYPFDFTLRVKHTIYDDGFETAYTVINNDAKTMPYCIGGHPGIMLGDYTQWTLNFEKEEQTTLYNVSAKGIFSESLKAGKINGRSLPLGYPNLFDNGALIARDIKSKSITITKNDKSESIKIDYKDYDLIAVWTPPKKNAPFICIEPWCGMSPCEDETGNMEDKPYVKFIAPGESQTYTYRVTIN